MSLLDDLTPYLRGVVTQQCYGPAISKVPFFTIDTTLMVGSERQDAKFESSMFAQQVRAFCRCDVRRGLPWS